MEDEFEVGDVVIIAPLTLRYNDGNVCDKELYGEILSKTYDSYCVDVPAFGNFHFLKSELKLKYRL